MKRVIVTKPFHGICWMQVCAVDDATDEEILDVCNKENPAGTTNGWMTVIRNREDLVLLDERSLPVPCQDEPGRTHFLVSC